MNPNFKRWDVDGFGDRPDIADARSKAEMQIMENKDRERFEIKLAVDRGREWGTSINAQLITVIVREMLEKECYQRLVLKNNVVWDVETLSEALTEACIYLSLSDEEFAPSYHDLGNEIDLRLV
ncbi:hypothetical protein [Scytonema sp. NUACC26]|uniref:hypothetical protein n=1 Tax=Scytonema sp. NUACC26 TaxID=3140176 RepID=UPI0034DC608C